MQPQPTFGHVLVVDDDENVRRLLDTKLRRAGATVALAGTGADALASVAASPPDLVVAAEGLPDTEACALIQALAALRPAPGIVVLSTRAAPAEIGRALMCGADDDAPLAGDALAIGSPGKMGGAGS